MKKPTLKELKTLLISAADSTINEAAAFEKAENPQQRELYKRLCERAETLLDVVCAMSGDPIAVNNLKRDW